MIRIGTPRSATATRVMLLGAGELGKEVVHAFQGLGVEVIACDRYANAPAMQVAHRSIVLDMQDPVALAETVRRERPHWVIPEIEAIATAALVELEREGFRIVPTANAVHLTMNRNGIRRLAAAELGLPTSPYRFVETEAALRSAAIELGFPCVVKPSMSSSGKGQSVVRDVADVAAAWRYAIEGTRGTAASLIVEGFVDFDYEITLLTVRHAGGVDFCAPIGHLQEDGDYRESWQPHPMSETALARAQAMAAAVTGALGGHGVFGVECFVRADDVLFSEVSPRPHDTGLVTLISQNLSEFALHARAVMGLPIPRIEQLGPSASAALLVEGDYVGPVFTDIGAALSRPGTDVRLFGKPAVSGRRRMGVTLARGESIESARATACAARDAIGVAER